MYVRGCRLMCFSHYDDVFSCMYIDFSSDALFSLIVGMLYHYTDAIIAIILIILYYYHHCY